MSDMIEYAGYKGSVEFSAKDRSFFGQVLFIDSLLMYHGTSIAEIEAAFKETIDSYLEFCKSRNREPLKPYSGSFNIRISPDDHKSLSEIAYLKDVSMNVLVAQALHDYVESNKQPAVFCVEHKHMHTHTHIIKDECEGNTLLEDGNWEMQSQQTAH